MKKKIILPGLLALALTLVLCTGVGPALAYFTDSSTAEGGIALNLGYTTTITETVTNLIKQLTIKNEEGVDVFIRARAFVGGDYGLSVGGDNWTADGDWYVYSLPVSATDSTKPLTVTVNNVPASLIDDDSFNVAVVYESTPAQYDENGTAYANWDITLVTGSSSSGGSGTEGGEGNG